MSKMARISLLSLLLLALCLKAALAAGFGGVGIDGVPGEDGTIVVRQLVTGGPAHLAGVKPGDIITQIDGTPTAGKEFGFLVERRLRGRAGTPILLVVRRAGNPKPLVFKLVRRQLKLGDTGKK